MRIRNLKPGFFKDADLYDAERASGLPLRLAYEGLWCVADREGRFKWKPREIKTDVLPYDDVDMALVMDALVKSGFIFKYKADGFEYGFIPTFKEHQFINKNEAPSTIPAPPENSNDYSEIVTHPELLVVLDTDILDTDISDKSAPQADAPKSSKPTLPDWLPKEPWASFQEMRRKIRAPLTGEAMRLAIGDLEKLRASGQDPGAVLNQSVMRSWRGLFPVEAKKNGHGRPEGSHEQTERIARKLIAAERARNNGADHGPDHSLGVPLPRVLTDDRRGPRGLDEDAV